VCVRFPSALIGRGGEKRGWAYPSGMAAPLAVLLTRSGSRQPGAWQAPRRFRVRGVRAFRVGPGREGRGEPRMGLPKRRGGLPVLLSGSRQPGAWQTPRRPHDSDRPVPARGVRSFPIGPGRKGRTEPRMGQPRFGFDRVGTSFVLKFNRRPGVCQNATASPKRKRCTLISLVHVIPHVAQKRMYGGRGHRRLTRQ
jgi:hypothetical protein